MFLRFFVFCYIITFSFQFIYGNGNFVELSSQARYDFYRVYVIELTQEEQVQNFRKLQTKSDSITFMNDIRKVGQNSIVLVAAHRIADFEDLLKTYKVINKVLSYNFQEKIDKNMAEVLPINTDVKKFDWQHYFHLDTIYAWMSHMAKQYPDKLTLLDMGTSTQGVPIKGLKLSHNPKNKAIFIESGIHAREWIAPATATYIINELLTSSNESVQSLAKNYNWIIFPVINPDGYKYTFERNRMWRKNRRLFDFCHGVDLNRNYLNQKKNSTGFSNDPCNNDYSGPSAGSEIETQRLMKFIIEHIEKDQIQTYIALHSYSQMIMFPYGYTKEHVTNYEDLKEFGEKAAARIKGISGRVYKSGSVFETIYNSNGISMDWAYSKMGIPIAYTFELRGPADGEDLFILPAKQINSTAAEAFAAIQTIIESAAEKGYYESTCLRNS